MKIKFANWLILRKHNKNRKNNYLQMYYYEEGKNEHPCTEK